MSAPACPYCGSAAKLVTGKVIYQHREDLHAKRFWQCEPCDARTGCHRETSNPLGTLANQETRRARMRAHAAFDPLWRADGAPFSRKAAYLALAIELGIEVKRCHIASFDAAQCVTVVEAAQRIKMLEEK